MGILGRHTESNGHPSSACRSRFILGFSRFEIRQRSPRCLSEEGKCHLFQYLESLVSNRWMIIALHDRPVNPTYIPLQSL